MSSRASSLLRQISVLGLPPKLVLPVLLDAVGRIVPYKDSTFYWLDTHGGMTDFYTTHQLSPELGLRLLDKYHDNPSNVIFPTQRQFILGRQAYDSIDYYKQRQPEFSNRYFRADFYEEVCIPHAHHHPIRLALRDGAQPIGVVIFDRAKEDQPFSATEIQSLLKAVPYMVRALTYSPPDFDHISEALWDSGLLLHDEWVRTLQHSERSDADAPRHWHAANCVNSVRQPLRLG